jgi:hypothetical protein
MPIAVMLMNGALRQAQGKLTSKAYGSITARYQKININYHSLQTSCTGFASFYQQV